MARSGTFVWQSLSPRYLNKCTVFIEEFQLSLLEGRALWFRSNVMA
jgi:hypothetical protein